MKVNITPVMMMAWAGRTSRRANVPGELGGSELGGTGCGAEEASDVLMGNLTFAPAEATGRGTDGYVSRGAVCTGHSSMAIRHGRRRQAARPSRYSQMFIISPT